MGEGREVCRGLPRATAVQAGLPGTAVCAYQSGPGAESLDGDPVPRDQAKANCAFGLSVGGSRDCASGVDRLGNHSVLNGHLCTSFIDLLSKERAKFFPV